MPSEAYGTPYYLTLDERNKLYAHDMSARPKIEIQRDIHIFHCVVGCRVGDLGRMKKTNIIDGALEYIAGKTKDGNPKTVRVPLNKIALEILEKYKDIEGERLLPFIEPQKHNDDLKIAYKLAGIDRIVTIMCPKTRLDIQKPLYEVASSHLARRTLAGNVYKIYKDTKIVGSITGHSPNSKAMARYVHVDDEMKNEVLKSLE
jgi:integrase